MIKHRGFFGSTGSGKTTLAEYMGRQSDGLVVFFNAQEESLRSAWAACGKNDRLDVVVPSGRAALRNYIPSADDEMAQLELNVLVNRMFALPATKTVLIVDEAQVYAPEGKDQGALQKVARRGRRYNIELWTVSQHPADISKKVVRQLHEHYIFELRYSDEYLKKYGIDADKLHQIHKERGKYSYAVWNGADLRGCDPLDL